MDIKYKLEQAVEARKNQIKKDKELYEARKQQQRNVITKLVNDFLEENLPRTIELGLGSLELELEHKDTTSDLLEVLKPYVNNTSRPRWFISEYVHEVYRPYLKEAQVIIRRYSYPFRKKDKVEVDIIFYTVTQL